jgi:hypothetical protein
LKLLNDAYELFWIFVRPQVTVVALDLEKLASRHRLRVEAFVFPFVAGALVAFAVEN